MNRFLFKYMRLRPDFFKDLMIRATPALALNDPFEGHFNKTQVRDADRNHADYYRKNGEKPHEYGDTDIDEMMGVIQSELSEMGILSFTEDYNNPLMWAHYADEHKGLVVEFDFSEPFFADSIKDHGGRKSRFGPNHLADFFEYPEKVDYRRTMPDFERPELSAPDSMSEFHWKKFNRTILFTKGNDWIYEKEQRSIVQLKDADSIICDDNELIRAQCDRDPSIQCTERENKRIQVTFPREYEMHEEMGDESIKEEIHRLALRPGKPPIHLFRINPQAISGVYFGCKAAESAALEDIRHNPSLQRLTNLFKMRPSKTEYQLVASRINT